MKRRILITGDVVKDHHLYCGERLDPSSQKKRGFRVGEPANGGAALVFAIVRSMLEMVPAPGAFKDSWSARFAFDEGPLGELPPQFHSYALWRPQPKKHSKSEQASKVKVWRADEPSLGYGSSNEFNPKVFKKTKESDLAPDILVIDDAAIAFRHRTAETLWPSDLGAGSGWIVLKQAIPVVRGDLWRRLIEKCGKRLVVIVSADDLRAENIRLSRGLSWESTVEDLQEELFKKPHLRPLLKAQHVIITFGSDGAFWLDNSSGKGRQQHLIFDTRHEEGGWASLQPPGRVFGHLSCFTAAIVDALCSYDSAAMKVPDFVAAMRCGLSAIRRLRIEGHGEVGDNSSGGFPTALIARHLIEDGKKDLSFTAAVLQKSFPRHAWSLLDGGSNSASRSRPHFGPAFAAALLGSSIFAQYPVARFRDLTTVDRHEIEALRSIRQLVDAYEKGGPQKKPLNLGVFGPPGSGKSFGIEEIAKEVLGENVPFLTFNLSEFHEPDELVGALHQVRDKVLSGKTPVVFWDEFDSSNYDWLQYLLAPMNDGRFLQGQITHPIGKSIFVFAGATRSTFKDFGEFPLSHGGKSGARQSSKAEVDTKALNDFILKKGPDFKSRLVGYLDILGPNPREVKELGGKVKSDPADICWPLRRAIFIRSQFKLEERDPLNMDLGLLRALLEIPKLKGGARSLVFLCQHLKQQAGGGTMRRSHLPGKAVLSMHVEVDEFWALCEGDQEFLAIADKIAPWLHHGYRQRIKGRDEKKHFDVRFEDLLPEEQESNLRQAYRILTSWPSPASSLYRVPSPWNIRN